MMAEEKGSASLCTQEMHIHEIPEHIVIRNKMTTFFHQKTKWHNVFSDKGIDNTATTVRKEKKYIFKEQ